MTNTNDQNFQFTEAEEDFLAMAAEYEGRRAEMNFYNELIESGMVSQDQSFRE